MAVVEEMKPKKRFPFVIAFVRCREDNDTLIEKMRGAGEVEPLFWAAYPKKSSNRYRVDISRDKGWDALLENWKLVRQITLDDNCQRSVSERSEL